MSVLRRCLLILLATTGLLVVVGGVAAFYGWRQMRGSLPQLDGGRRLAGLTAAVTIQRDALGMPDISGATRIDVARATGFVHAQDRFFQMDLLRRRGAGELAELFGSAALEIDRSARLHDFRRVAEQVVAQASPEERAVLRAYTEGVNAGLSALHQVPWEYLVLRTPPQPWREEDTILCVYAMWFDLQDSTGSFERDRAALREACGQDVLDFFAPQGNSWDAALDGSMFPPAPLPVFRFKPANSDSPSATAQPGLVPGEMKGSNAFALAGAHTSSGAALLANDMHLTLGVPNTWYRAALRWSDARGPHRIVGVMLPGTPFVIAGSNGRVAWGFTDAYVDTTDVILVDANAAAGRQYRTAQGWVPFEERTWQVKVKGQPPETFTSRWTEWGPVISGPDDGFFLVLHWSAHDAAATNLKLMEMETAGSTSAAIEIAHRAGLPNENIVIADSNGHIAWTIAGKIPRRIGYDGRLPVSWAYGDRKWDGWLKPEEVPVVLDPPDGILWSANNRALDGKAYALLGDSGYDRGARAGQIRDDLRALVASGRKAAPADLLAVQLDDRALFLARWQKFLLEVLSDEAVAQNRARGALRHAVRQWDGRAGVNSAAYRIVRAFRLHVAERTLAPFATLAQDQDGMFSFRHFLDEDALWKLVHEQPVHLLNPAKQTWESLLRAAADDVLADAKNAGIAPDDFIWGTHNMLAMRHPFSRFLPGVIARFLNMPADPLPGDNDMPRVQGPDFGQSERLVVSPGQEAEGILAMPGGQSDHPLSPYYRAGHEAWVRGEPTPLLPGQAQHTLVLRP